MTDPLGSGSTPGVGGTGWGSFLFPITRKPTPKGQLMTPEEAQSLAQHFGFTVEIESSSFPGQPDYCRFCRPKQSENETHYYVVIDLPTPKDAAKEALALYVERQPWKLYRVELKNPKDAQAIRAFPGCKLTISRVDPDGTIWVEGASHWPRDLPPGLEHLKRGYTPQETT